MLTEFLTGGNIVYHIVPRTAVYRNHVHCTVDKMKKGDKVVVILEIYMRVRHFSYARSVQ